MTIKCRHQLLTCLGAVLGLVAVGCHAPPFDGARTHSPYQQVTHRYVEPAPPPVEMLRPRVAEQDQIIRIGHNEVGGAVSASSWRSTPRAPERVEAGSLNLRPTPNASTWVRPVRPQGAETPAASKHVTVSRQRDEVVQAGGTTMAAKVAQKAVPAVHGPGHHAAPGLAPHEGALICQPLYRIAPPDVLLVRMIRPRVVPDEAPQLIDGEHLVRPDGTVQIGVYGSVCVAGMTIEEARHAIAILIAERIKYKDLKDEPKAKHIEAVLLELVVDVIAYRSKFYYVIADGGGPGEQVVPILVTGNDTVLDAIGKVGGLPPQACKKKIWVARAANKLHPHEMLPVDWKAITMRGQKETNYQLFCGDRIYVNSDPRLRAYTQMDRTYDLFDRTAGTLILGSTMVRSLSGGFGGNRNNN